MTTKHELKVGSRSLIVSNLDKVFYPETGFTKGQLIDYYIRVSKYLLPHFKNRPVTLVRYPNGIAGKSFYEKNAPSHTPDWVKTFPVPRRGGGPDINYVMVNDLPTLVWCANIATIEFHPFLHRAPHIGRPTQIVFDLDPGPGASILKCAEIGFILRDVLKEIKLESFPKVSGSKGIQIYVPLNTPVDYEAARGFAHSLARLLERQYPKQIISEMTKSERTGKIFIDWSQNSDFKTTAGVYSLRAKRAQPYVSAPVSWDELQKAVADEKPASLDFSPEATFARCESMGDLMEPVLKLKQRLPKVLKT